MARKKTSDNSMFKGRTINGNSSQATFSFGNGGGITKEAASNTSLSSSMFYSPELTSESWLLPKSRQEILKWARIFFNLEPYVFAITKMHSKFPFSTFELQVDDPSIQEFYEDMCFNESFNITDFLLKASLCYHKFGEAVPFGNMVKGKDNLYRWSHFILLEPELVEIKQVDLMTPELQFEMVPTEELKSIIKSSKPEDMDRVKQWRESEPELVAAVEEGRNVKLDSNNVSVIADLTDASATRGTSPIQCLFKVLIYQDWIRLAQSAFAQRYVFPIELWTIGDLDKQIIPTEQQLDEFRGMINQAIQNPPFTMIFPPTVKYQALSTLGAQFPINNEYEYIHDQIMVGMGVNKNLILGEGPSFSNMQALSLQKLIMEYKTTRDKFENWLKYKFFAPIARKNNFYTTSHGKKKLVLPTISWNKSLDIEEENSEKETFKDFHSKGLISTKTLFSKFPNLDYEQEQKYLEQEIGSVFDKGDERLPKSLGKRKGKGKGGGGGGGMGGGGTPSGLGGDTPAIEPIEPVEPGEEGATPGGTSEAPTETTTTETTTQETSTKPTTPDTGV